MKKKTNNWYLSLTDTEKEALKIMLGGSSEHYVSFNRSPSIRRNIELNILTKIRKEEVKRGIF